MNRLAVVACAAWLVAAGAQPVIASDTAFADIARIEQAGRLVVGIPATERPPYVVNVVGDDPQGFDLWLARGLAKGLGVDLVLDRSASTPADVIAKVNRGEVDLGLGGIGIDLDAAKLVRFSRPYVREATALLLNRHEALSFNGACPSFDEIGGIVAQKGAVAAAKGTSAADQIGELFPDAAPRLYDDELKQFAAVQSGEVIISVHDEAEARYRLRKKPSARINVRLCLSGGVSRLIAIAVRPDSPDLHRLVNLFLETELVDLSARELLDFGEREKLWP